MMMIQKMLLKIFGIFGLMTIKPFISLREDRDAQEDGWCSILNKGDIELGEGKVVKEYIDGQWITVSEPVSWLSYGLLWDQCKECRYKISFK